MARTERNTALRLNVAVNYGGRWDIAQARARSQARSRAARRRSRISTKPRSVAMSASPTSRPSIFSSAPAAKCA
jgi:undecaprenyl pyrophosphate synthase